MARRAQTRLTGHRIDLDYIDPKQYPKIQFGPISRGQVSSQWDWHSACLSRGGHARMRLYLSIHGLVQR
jgi:hypothetical protein